MPQRMMPWPNGCCRRRRRPIQRAQFAVILRAILTRWTRCLTPLKGACAQNLKSRDWLGIIAGIARDLDAPVQCARAVYSLAQMHAARGEFDAAQTLIEDARQRYLQAGRHDDALRTGVGRIHVLKELGRYSDALEVAHDILAQAEAPADGANHGEDGANGAQARRLIAAFAHHNQGVCYEQMGRYDEALAAYQAAEERYGRLGEYGHMAEIVNNRGVIQLHLGRVAEALSAFETAATMYDPANDAVKRAQTLINIGVAHARLGGETNALAAFESAHRVLSEARADVEAQIALLDMAEAYLGLNLHAEAAAAYRDVIARTADMGMQHEHARAQWGLGAALAELGRHGAAAQAFTAASDWFASTGNTPMLCAVLLQQSLTHERLGDSGQALATVERARALSAAGSWPLQQAEAQLRLVELSAAPTDAMMSDMRALVEAIDLPRLRIRLLRQLGRAALSASRPEDAAGYFEMAVALIEAQRAGLDRVEFRATFVRDKDAAYADLAQALLAQSAAPEAVLAVVERAKARSLAETVAGARSGNGSQQSGSAIAQLRIQLNGLYSRLMQGPGDDGAGAFTQLQFEAIDIERKLSSAQLRRVASGAADPVVHPISADALLRSLPADLTTVSYFCCHNEILANVVTRDGVRLTRHVAELAHVNALLDDLELEWQRFQLGESFVRKHMTRLEASAQQALHALHQALVRPLEDMLTKGGGDGGTVRKLIVTPHGSLHRVPFQALHDGRQWLIDAWEVSYAPSCTLAVQRPARHRPGRARCVAFGCSDEWIPNAEDEARTVAQLYGGVDYLGQAATVAALRAAVAGCDVLHVACHGLYRNDNPMFSALKLHDGWLRAADIVDCDLKGAIVALSACDSARTQLSGGNELMGLTRAFLGAGAASLVVGQWLVSDATTATLMVAWHTLLQQGQGCAAALRMAQLRVRAEHSHPFYWAPFVLFGQRE
jgi:CHAT domain-containing protein